MKSVLQFFSSIKLTIILLIIFATTIAIATFIENDYGVQAAWAAVFKTRWFEILQLLLIINLILNLFKYKMYSIKKLPVLTFHLSFVFILIGSAMTRYYGYEGMMSIREGYSENRMLSSDAYLQIQASKNNKTYQKEENILLSSFGSNEFNYSLDVEKTPLRIKYKDFITNAKRVLQKDKKGQPIMKLFVTTKYGPEEYIIKNNSVVDAGMLRIYFNKEVDTKGAYLKLFTMNERLYFVSNTSLGYELKGEKKQGFYEKNKVHTFETDRYYKSNYFNIEPSYYLKKGVMKIVSEKSMANQSGLSALIVDISYDNKTQEVALLGKGKHFKGYTKFLDINDTKITLEWGSKIIRLPFSLHLKKFVLEKYSGSKSPSSYESHVTLLDSKEKIQKDFNIYMNNTLTYSGFTFYQSSYDQDEKGTVLSVNKDPGKWPTYLGYFLLIAGMVINLINPHSRFFKLAQTKYKSASKIAAVLLALLAFNFTTPVQAKEKESVTNKNSRAYVNSLNQNEVIDYITKIDKNHADLFASIIMQSIDGRMQPINTYAIDAINKLTGGKNFFNLTPNQIFVGMVTRSKYWQRIKMFKVKHPEVKKLLGLETSHTRFSYIEAFSKQGQYKFLDAAQKALRTKPANRGNLEKEILKIDERLNVAFNIFEGTFFKVFPKMNALDNHWLTAKEALQNLPENNKTIIHNILRKNIRGLQKGYDTGNWGVANEAILDIIQYQTQHALKLPSNTLMDAEVLYNQLKIFERLYPVYLISGLILLVLIFIKLLKPNFTFKTVTQMIFVLFILTFIVHTANLGLRWYVAGHAPWSNSYEAMLYISWTIILSGIVFAKQSDFALSSTGIFSGITLFVAHLSWLDPQITNLVPVLKSYWLTIHVSVITASYGFLGLSAMLGFITLTLLIMLYFVKNERSLEQIMINIKESVRINELSMTIGLTLLIAGNFLGAVWANESWGRYWGWDPKETWTLVTILVYAVIIHLRYIKKLINAYYLFSTLSLLAYSTVIMTYFGVNYYLTGLHSYATGAPIPIPTWIYYTLAVIVVFIALAYNNKNHIKNYTIHKY